MFIVVNCYDVELQNHFMDEKFNWNLICFVWKRRTMTEQTRSNYYHTTNQWCPAGQLMREQITWVFSIEKMEENCCFGWSRHTTFHRFHQCWPWTGRQYRVPGHTHILPTRTERKTFIFIELCRRLKIHVRRVSFRDNYFSIKTHSTSRRPRPRASKVIWMGNATLNRIYNSHSVEELAKWLVGLRKLSWQWFVERLHGCCSRLPASKRNGCL